MMRRPLLLTLGSSLCLLLAFGAGGCNDESDEAAFTVALSGANEVPPNDSTATGAATFAFDGDSSVQFRVEVHSITDVMAAHIHSGALGVNGSVRVTLFDNPTAGPTDGELVSGTFGPADVDEGISFDALLQEMRDGTAYVNVHTSAHPNGEIRGQIRLAQ